jgi:DNA polymerase (family 10)
MREAWGEIEAAAEHKLPRLITVEDIRGEVHMHTVETDGNSIDEMAEAARQRGYQYIAITDHSKNLAFANGLDDKRAAGTHRAHSRGQRADRRHHHHGRH